MAKAPYKPEAFSIKEIEKFENRIAKLSEQEKWIRKVDYIVKGYKELRVEYKITLFGRLITGLAFPFLLFYDFALSLWCVALLVTTFIFPALRLASYRRLLRRWDIDEELIDDNVKATQQVDTGKRT